MENARIKKNHELLNIAKILRRNMTKQEKHLWYDFLQRYPIKTYKQRIIDNFIADFYCHKARLVIEIDGAQHYEHEVKKYDEKRTEYLESIGIKVIRILNGQINKDFENVCRYINSNIDNGE